MGQRMQEKIKQLDTSIGLSKKERMESYVKWAAYWNHIANNHAKRKGFSDLFEQSVVQLLKKQGIFDENSNILDIGCGSGTYTLDFAKNCHAVKAVDMSETMLSVLQARAKEEKVCNVTCDNSLFEDLREEDQYDLVFAAMCPAICDFDSLKKLERLSKKHCCIVTVAKDSASHLRRNLRMQLTNERLKGLSPDVIDQFDLLYEWGRYPNIQFFHFTAHTAMELEQAIETYNIYYDIFGFNQPHHHHKIRTYLSEIAQNNICTDKVTYHMAVMWWNVQAEHHE